MEHQSPCEFCEIALGRAPAHIAWQTRLLTVFADHAPIRPGHVQIIPRAHYPYFDDLPADVAAEIVWLGQRIATVQKRAYGVERVAFVFTGNDVPHCHAHLIPLHSATDVTSARYFEGPLPPRQSIGVVDDVLRETARDLARALSVGERSRL